MKTIGWVAFCVALVLFIGAGVIFDARSDLSKSHAKLSQAKAEANEWTRALDFSCGYRHGQIDIMNAMPNLFDPQSTSLKCVEILEIMKAKGFKVQHADRY